MGDARPINAIDKAQRYTEKGGCHRLKTDSTLRFDAFMFLQVVIAAVRVKKILHAVDENVFIEHLFPEEVDALHSLPFPRTCSAPRALGTDAEQTGMVGDGPTLYRIPRYKSGSTWQRGYKNPYFREDEWRDSLHHPIAQHSLKEGIRKITPIQALFSKRTEFGSGSNGICVLAHGKYWLNGYISNLTDFRRF